MTGFRDFLLRGNLVELAVAFIMGTVFATVVSTFTDIGVAALGLLVDVRGFDQLRVAGLPVGSFVTAVVTFVLTAAVLYFGVVLPYQRLRRLVDDEAAGPAAKPASSEELLTEIRDLLRARSDQPTEQPARRH